MARKFNTPLGLAAMSADPVGTEAGQSYWNTSLNAIRIYNGTTWQSAGGGSTQRTFAFFAG